MKRIIALLFFIFFVGHTYAQNISQSNVPAVVLNNFQLKYPTVDDIKWKLENGNYRVDFKLNRKDNSLTINYKGNILKHHQDLYVSEIPKVVMNTIRNKVGFFDVNDADKYEVGNKTTYEIQFKIDKKRYYFWISKYGKLLKYRKELKDSEIPSSMIRYIKDKFRPIDIGRAKYVESEGSIKYIIRAKKDDLEHVFVFGNNGVLLMHTTQNLRYSDIPALVLNAARKAYKGYEMHRADLINEGGKSTYKLEMRKSSNSVKLMINAQGKILEINNKETAN